MSQDVTHHQAILFGTDSRAVMLCDCEDNCSSGVTLATRHTYSQSPPACVG